MANDPSSYSHMESVLQQITKNFISLPQEMTKQYNIYQHVVNGIIDKMKEVNPLFKQLFSKIFYGGSYYDKLKISKPEEFDLDLLLKLPEYAKPELLPSDLPGFVTVRLLDFEKFQQQPEYKSYYTDFPKILDDDYYLNADKVRIWMESVINKTLNRFEKSGDQNVFHCELESGTKTFLIKLVKGGPAFTLQINDADMKMDVDLVPCFVFINKWPVHCNFKPNPFNDNPALKSFFIVPKKPHGVPVDGLVARCWRMSFQEQERELIKGQETLKPALKLLKKFRDNLNHKSISSYFLKTIFLFEVQKRDKNFWVSDLSSTFIEMLTVYYSYLDKKCIPYYWNENHNMISHIGEIQLENVSNKVRNVIKEIKRTNDPFVVAKHLLNPSELGSLKETYVNKNSSIQVIEGKIVAPSLSRVSSALPMNYQPSINQTDNNVMVRLQTIQDGLQTVNVTVNKVCDLLQSLSAKMDHLTDRVNYLELVVTTTSDAKSTIGHNRILE